VGRRSEDPAYHDESPICGNDTQLWSRREKGARTLPFMDTLARRPRGDLGELITSARRKPVSTRVGPSGGEVAVLRRRAVGLRTPAGTWRWWETAVVGATITLIVAAVASMNPQHISATGLASSSAVVAYTVAFLASVLLYIHWRMTSGGPLAWLVLGLSAVSVQTLAMSGLVAADPERVEGRPGMVLLTQVVIAAGILSVLWLARRRFTPDPLATGVVLGAVLFASRYAVLALTPHMDLGPDGLQRLALIVLLLDVTIAVGVAVFPKAPRWVRYRIALALAVLGVAQAVVYPVPDDSTSALIAVVCNIAGAAILFALGVALVRLSIRDNRAAIALLGAQLARVEEVKRAEQAQLHEIRATIAGISSAARVINTYEAVAPVRRARIRDMIDAEISRLERLMNPAESRAIVEVDLDNTLEPIVVRLLTQGRPVRWAPTGQVALGRADDIAEIVNILLENAVRHGRGAAMAVSVRTIDRSVEIAVSDAGPGVPCFMRDQIFEWGRTRPGSPGDGIGLHEAKRLSTELGGTLELVESEAPGATFVLVLPAPGERS
jgi:signal transduction histidine kinase